MVSHLLCEQPVENVVGVARVGSTLAVAFVVVVPVAAVAVLVTGVDVVAVATAAAGVDVADFAAVAAVPDSLLPVPEALLTAGDSVTVRV